ncbi:aminoacyl-tRNA hydrolase [Amphibiibacter pelophylacis]|uniref:Aminoacyl-tRNA hydrolase n=1 Tax=Amphibiibacter pelophylacis TaxID=1799477 RepID=A0ACC6P1J2_9BURK
MSAPRPLRLLVGLGNPGPEYDDTRHNAGFAWVQRAADVLGARWAPERSYFGLVARTQVAGESVWLLQPHTFMNASGKSVAALARFFKISPEETLVIHDELDLPPGQVKLKLGGGHAGHNGLRDIAAHFGSDTWRLRLGVGHPGHRDGVIGWVLQRAPKDQREALDAAIAKSMEALPPLLAGDMAAATRLIHASPPKPKKPPAPRTVAAPGGPADPPAA